MSRYSQRDADRSSGQQDQRRHAAEDPSVGPVGTSVFCPPVRPPNSTVDSPVVPPSTCQDVGDAPRPRQGTVGNARDAAVLTTVARMHAGARPPLPIPRAIHGDMPGIPGLHVAGLQGGYCVQRVLDLLRQASPRLAACAGVLQTRRGRQGGTMLVNGPFNDPDQCIMILHDIDGGNNDQEQLVRRGLQVRTPNGYISVRLAARQRDLLRLSSI